jgi:hypothetical protein
MKHALNAVIGTPSRYLHALTLCVAIGLAVSPGRSLAADPANLEGTWRIASPRAAFITDAATVPFTDAGRKRYEQNKVNLAKGNYDAYDMANARCASPGLPRLMLTPDRFRVWQRKGMIQFQFEWNRLSRQILMSDLMPQIRVGGIGPQDEALVGRTVPLAKGSWQGDTLVVSSEGFDDTTLIDNLVPHGRRLKLTEHIRLKSRNTLEDRLRIEDPDYFTQPWEAVVSYSRQPDDAFPEDVCLDRLGQGKPTL